MSACKCSIRTPTEKGFGAIEVGANADFAIVSLGCENTIGKEDLRGKSTNTPFLGMTFQAKVDYTYVGGVRVYADPQNHRLK